MSVLMTPIDVYFANNLSTFTPEKYKTLLYHLLGNFVKSCLRFFKPHMVYCV
nr:MAG TPA_asm: hypothetical protein [Caudoviricetes sp.]